MPDGITLDHLIRKLETDPTGGLSEKQAAERLAHYGQNKIRDRKKKTNLRRFLDQFKDVMILILIAAALTSFVIACFEGGLENFFEPVLILLIVILNAFFGVLQENRAEKALDALKGLSAPHARVIREGTEQIIDAARLVPGDIIRLEAGDFVPADARLLQSANLKSEESALTGESMPAEKDASADVPEDAPLGDRTNMVFAGCSVTYGTATALILSTGMHTEMGKIADLLDSEDDTLTPLQKRLAKLGKHLGIAALAACAVIFVLGIISGIPVMDIFMTAVSLAVSAIPEGLPAIVTIILAIGVQNMVKQNAIIRNLPAVETLGSASVICSDKTGTLTQNRMTLVKAYTDGAEDVEEISERNSEAVNRLLMLGTLCSNGTVLFEDDTQRHIGDPTETAIVLAAHQTGLVREELFSQYPRLAEIPFDSERKLMSVVSRIDGKNLVIVKGAYDNLRRLCTGGDLVTADRKNEAMSRQALRVLGIACKEIDQVPEQPKAVELERGLHFLGLVGMIDPPRPEAKKAVAVCRSAGIRPVMITGDHVITASAIARKLDILQEGGESITGAALDEMADEELDGCVRSISVYARVSPENKIRIVRAWQRSGEVVAMTGDGVNDAPALKAADIGCAMGITGTDVAKGAADMTLTDDNFATIVEAVKEGRGIYANIKKVVGFLLGTNIGELLAVFLSMVLWQETPLLSMQLLWINLVTDSLPAIALGMERAEPHLMNQKPKPKGEGIFAHGLGVRIVLQGVMFMILTLTGFQIGLYATGEVTGGRTMAFLVLSMSQVLHSFNMRSNRSLFQVGPFSNRKLNWAVLVSVLLILLVLFTPVSIPFGLIALPVWVYLTGFGFAILPILILELAKATGLIRDGGAR